MTPDELIEMLETGWVLRNYGNGWEIHCPQGSIPVETRLVIQMVVDGYIIIKRYGKCREVVLA